MAVTTEPPWTNVGSGTADRNGTSTHVIPFGFTTAADSLVVVVVFGGVTHTVSGWTEQLSPVSSGELSVFTKVSTGDADITVTHNASNYPVQWVAYEFPEGSTYTAGQSNNASDETFPDLAGLPGVEQVVIAARGRIAGGSESGASTTWTGPWVEDVDLFTANSPTDGCYLTVGHQINVTATSITPSASTTYDGTWGVGDREKVVFALDVAAPVGVAVTGQCVAVATTTATVLKVSLAVGTAVGVATAQAAAVHVATASGRTVAAGTTTAVAVHRTPVVATTPAVATTTAATVKRVAASGATVAVATTTAVVTQPGGPVAVVARCVAVALCHARLRRITRRPNTGIRTRPFTGITYRP